ncbi:trehalose-6-phosphate synthase [Planosporangium thailandense]|uniref:Trehalose-6-phosphate synthase n=1 Tax=Planosporangium thailandense TaxID=765197 RepID=A0ABX0Y6I0_9ACTN|nr:trehalose-6-phosphate synthase [Planosporangium thailandense]
MSEQYRFVVVANRLPVDEVVGADGERAWTRSPGGLVSALHPTVRARRGAWIGWAGGTGDAPEPFELDGMRLYPVGLSSEEVDYYYEGESNATIWPLYHDAVETPAFHRHWREAYRRVNQRFADAAAELAAPGATVWVHDYQLQLVPAMLRARRPDLRIGFFLHIPFPPVELFMQLPWRTQVLRGLLGADLVGFQRPGGAENFLRLTRTLLGLEPEGDHVVVDGRTVTARAFPISIDVAEMERLAADPRIRQRAAELSEELGGRRRLLLGVDRLDYTKGIEHRLKAYRELLAEGRLSAKDVVLVQVATPSRLRVAQYRQLRERVEREVGRINGEYGEVGLAPVHYLFRAYDREELLALYLAADVMLVTPLRDGMNLVAKEYVAARTDHTGALVLSEFTGAAAELPEAFGVNPHDVDGLKEAFVQALEVPDDERRARMRRMREQVCAHDVTRWAREFLEALGERDPAVPGPR